MYVESSRAIHYGGSSSANAPVRFYIEKAKADLQYWRKHESFSRVRVYLLITILHEAFRVLGFSLLAPFKDSARYKVKRGIAALRWLISADKSGEMLIAKNTPPIKIEVSK